MKGRGEVRWGAPRKHTPTMEERHTKMKSRELKMKSREFKDEER
jgi:hypothetical protein